ncbi:MAG: hypothetical protein ACPIOQ_47730, partial [Promethearchaeia archaeon]
MFAHEQLAQTFLPLPVASGTDDYTGRHHKQQTGLTAVRSAVDGQVDPTAASSGSPPGIVGGTPCNAMWTPVTCYHTPS